MRRLKTAFLGRIVTALAIACAGTSFGQDEETAGEAAPAGEVAATEAHAGEEHTAAHDEDLGHGNAGSELLEAAEFKSDLAIYTFVVFLGLLAILARFAWPQVVAALEARERHIADHISAAEGKHDEAKQLLAQHEAKLAGAADEVRALLEEARRDAEHTKAEIIAEAKKAAQDEAQRAVREVEQAKNAALVELANRSANAAIELAGTVVRQQIDPTRQAEIIREALGKLSTGTPSNN